MNKDDLNIFETGSNPFDVFSGNGWKPRQAQGTILKRATEHLDSVPYTVTARWLFYRLLQDSLYSDKKDYNARFMPLISKARKQFYDGWHPAILADDTRAVVPGGDGFDSPDEWLEAVKVNLAYKATKWIYQDYYIEVWFEAAAMEGQFKYYLKEIPLLAFRGDTSIPNKWNTAKRLERASKLYDLPVVVIYFGDDDEKGHTIPDSALKDIRAWCNVDFKYIRAGLNKGDGERLGIAENPEKPGTYQWEALADEQAKAVIESSIEPYFAKEALADIIGEQDEVTAKFKQKFVNFIADWNK